MYDLVIANISCFKISLGSPGPEQGIKVLQLIVLITLIIQFNANAILINLPKKNNMSNTAVRLLIF